MVVAALAMVPEVSYKERQRGKSSCNVNFVYFNATNESKGASTECCVSRRK